MHFTPQGRHHYLTGYYLTTTIFNTGKFYIAYNRIAPYTRNIHDKRRNRINKIINTTSIYKALSCDFKLIKVVGKNIKYDWFDYLRQPVNKIDKLTFFLVKCLPPASKIRKVAKKKKN